MGELILYFLHLKADFEACGDQMESLYAYVVGSTVWKPRDICVYRRLVRTNNDAEGYHKRLYTKCGENPPVYTLVKILHKEARLVDINYKLITRKNISKYLAPVIASKTMLDMTSNY